VRGLWLQEALAGAEPAPRLRGGVTADVCIVGGGYTGLWTALRIKELAPDAVVVLVEQDVCGNGASGRNNGQLLDWWAKLASFEKHVGAADALRLGRMAEDAIGAIGDFCAAEGIDAGFRRSGWLWAASNEAQAGAWSDTVNLLADRGVDALRPVDRDEAVQLGASRRLLGGVLQERAAVVQPAKLARGLRDVAIARGVQIYERTPMTRLGRGRPAQVHTPAGVVTADSVVLAMNAWLTRFREVARSMFVVGSDIAASEPIPERLDAAGITSGVPLTDSRMLLKYVRTTPDGRILSGLAGSALVGPFGGAAVLTGPPSPARARRLARSLHFLFPALEDVPLTRCWTGAVDRSWTGIPFFGSLGGDPRLVFGAGYSGNGVAPSYVAGRVLASRALGLDDEWADVARLLPPRGGLPPEPIRYVGGRLVHAAVARRERLEDAGRRADPLTGAVASLAPSGVVPMRGRAGDAGTPADGHG
jgi:glycine/D-amino acid oxidase-like deaminating enzyme